MEKQFLTPSETVATYINGAKSKVNTPFSALLFKAVLAGMFIAFGAAGASLAAHAITNVGLQKLVSAVVFPVGLMMVVVLGAELFTGDCLMGMALVRKEIKLKSMLRVLAVVYLGNFIGSLILVCFVSLSGQLDIGGGMLGAYAVRTAVSKTACSFIGALVSGILCNILVCAAVLIATASKQIVGKLFSCFFLIMLFIVSGYEHSVANMFYIPLGIVANCSETYHTLAVSAYRIDTTALTVPNMFINNIIPVTIGNIIGGMAILGIPMSLINKSNEK